MTNRTGWTFVLGVVVAIAGAVALGFASGVRPQATSKIATVTLKTLLRELKENQRYESEMKAQEEKDKGELEDLKKKYDKQKEGVEQFKGNKKSDEFLKMNLALEELGILIRNRNDALAMYRDFKAGSALKSVYEGIVTATSTIAQQDGYDLVLVDDTGIETPEVGGIKAVSAPILSRQILYRTDAIDITQAVLTKMNADFEAGGGKKR